MTRLLDLIRLPPEISRFERSYLQRVNRVALVFFALHVPVFALVAWANHTGPALAALLTSIVVLGPAAGEYTLTNPRSVSMIHGVSAMFMGGLLVHFGQGPVQIEMHFYFFASARDVRGVRQPDGDRRIHRSPSRCTISSSG